MRRILWTVTICLLAALTLAQGALAAGDQVSGVTLNQVRQNGADLTAYVSLNDNTGYPIIGSFDPSQFSISVDNVASSVDSVQSFDPQKQGIHYVFAIDVSRTLSTDTMNSIRSSLNQFLGGLGPHDIVTVISFGAEVKTRIAESGDMGAVKNALANVAPNEDWTALYEGVLSAATAAKGGRSAVVVITDGKNDLPNGSSSPTKDDIFAQLRQAQVPLYCIGITGKQGLDTASLGELANATGGESMCGPVSDVSGALNRVLAITRSAIELHTTLTNANGRTGFNEPSTISVGFQAEDEGFIISNDLQQNINWGSVPAPTPAPTSVPVPEISLELDESSRSVMYTPGAKTVLTGLIGVEQGGFAEEDLEIVVNGEAWRTTLTRNGDDYTFSAEGVIGENVTKLDVVAVIHDREGENDVASRVQTSEVVVPTATPAPALSMELDDRGRDILFVSGQTVTIGGTINVQGDIDPNDMELYINGVLCDRTIAALQTGLYEFTADVVLPEEVIPELRVQVVLKSANVRSPTQTLPLVAPTPVPDPELSLTLSDETVLFTGEEPPVIRGNIEVTSGQVAQDDLALYVNNAKWNMNLEPQSDGSYSFEATPEGELVGSITKLNVRVRLISNTNVSSELISLAVATPEPVATPTPTPRPQVTPPPTAVPTQVPVTEPPEADAGGSGSSMYYYIGGAVAALAVILIIVLIVVKKKKKDPVVLPVGVTTKHDNGDALSGTVREDDAASSLPATVRDGTVQGGASGSDFIDEDEPDQSSGHRTSGTMRLDASGGTVNLGPGGGTVRLDTASGGTVRLDDEAESAGGTVRLEEHWELTVNLEESRKNSVQKRTLRMTEGQELVLGRSIDADVVIDDESVSSRHLTLRFDGVGLTVTDMRSTNGTKINNAAVVPDEACQLVSGDQVRVGKTTLKFSFGEPELL